MAASATRIEPGTVPELLSSPVAGASEYLDGTRFWQGVANHCSRVADEQVRPKLNSRR